MKRSILTDTKKVGQDSQIGRSWQASRKRLAWNDIRAVACRALQGCGLVEKHPFAGDEPNRIVTALTFHALVAALQRKLRALVVIKGGRHPPLRGVTLRAWNFLRSGDELAGMRIGMALIATLRRSLELDFLLTWSWFVATVAGHCPMSPEQGKFCLAVVEALDVYP